MQRNLSKFFYKFSAMLLIYCKLKVKFLCSVYNIIPPIMNFRLNSLVRFMSSQEFSQ